MFVFPKQPGEASPLSRDDSPKISTQWPAIDHIPYSQIPDGLPDIYWLPIQINVYLFVFIPCAQIEYRPGLTRHLTNQTSTQTKAEFVEEQHHDYRPKRLGDMRNPHGRGLITDKPSTITIRKNQRVQLQVYTESLPILKLAFCIEMVEFRFRKVAHLHMQVFERGFQPM